LPWKKRLQISPWGLRRRAACRLLQSDPVKPNRYC
jgi:hypothetical protein